MVRAIFPELQRVYESALGHIYLPRPCGRSAGPGGGTGCVCLPGPAPLVRVLAGRPGLFDCPCFYGGIFPKTLSTEDPTEARRSHATAPARKRRTAKGRAVFESTAGGGIGERKTPGGDCRQKQRTGEFDHGHHQEK